MGNIIVTGSSGFLGSAVTRELLDCGYHVFAVQNNRPVKPLPGMTILHGGIKSLTTDQLNAIRPEAIFHCARPVIPRFHQWGRTMAAFRASRLNRFLLDQIRACTSAPSLIFASGSLMYGNSDIPHPENTPLNPLSYARQYHRGEAPILKAMNTGHSRILMLRFPWILGNGSWFSWFYQKPLQEVSLAPLFGDGTNRMTLISLGDAAKMMVSYHQSPLVSGIYNVFSPGTITQRSFADTVATHYSGSVSDYRKLFPGGVEKAVFEAFTSNILLTSNQMTILQSFQFKNLEEMLNEMSNG